MGVVASDRARHLGDGDLVRLLDGAVTGPTRHLAEAHVASCERCGERFARLRNRSGRLSRLLGEQTEVEWLPAPRVARLTGSARAGSLGGRRSWAPYAVAAGLLLAMAVAGPARGWILDGVRTLLGNRSPEPSVSATSALDKTSGMAVTFAPEGGEVLFWLADSPARGVLELQATGDGRVTAALTGDQTTEEIIVVPNGVQVRNTTASVADYRLTVRAGTRVRLRVGTAGPDRDTMLTATPQLTRIELSVIRSR